MATREGQQKFALEHAPAELTAGRLQRLGEGIGKVVYASEHWVVKRERSPTEIVALIAIWRFLRRIEHMLPRRLERALLERPSRQIRLIRVALQGALFLIPQGVWLRSRLGIMWRKYRKRDLRGEILAERYLAGTGIVPQQVEFPPVRVRVGGWPGWLTVSEATERVEATLHQRLHELARAGRFEEIDTWLQRMIELRMRGWERGIFSTDAHLKNFGVTGDSVVLLDPGGLTKDWEEIERRLILEEAEPEPHLRLGLGELLASRPDLAAKFNARWKAVVNRDEVARRLMAARSSA